MIMLKVVTRGVAWWACDRTRVDSSGMKVLGGVIKR